MAHKRTYTASQALEPVPEFSDTVMNHIYYVADSMIGKANYVEDDRCDLIQELSLAAWQAMSTYQRNENATIDTYVCRAVDIASRNLFRNRNRKNRNISTISLEECAIEEKHEALLPAVDDREKIDLCIDVREVVDSMPADLKTICQLLMDGYNFLEIAKMTGTSDTIIRRRRLPEIREYFVRNGIDYRCEEN